MASVTLLEYTIRPLRRIRSLSSDTRWNSVYTVYSGGQRFRSLTWLKWHINKKSAKKFKILQPNCTFFSIQTSCQLDIIFLILCLCMAEGSLLMMNFCVLLYMCRDHCPSLIIQLLCWITQLAAMHMAASDMIFFRWSMFIVIPCS